MRQIIIVTLLAGIIISSYFLFAPRNETREDYEAFLKSHAYQLELLKGEPRGEGASKPDRPDLAFMQDFLRTMDPKLKRPLPELLDDINIKTARIRDLKRP